VLGIEYSAQDVPRVFEAADQPLSASQPVL